MLFLFSKVEITQLAAPFQCSVLLKFLGRRPWLDHIPGFIKNRWGLQSMPMDGQLLNLRSVLVRMEMEDDFISVMARGNSEMLGSPFWVFHWTPNYVEDKDSPWVLV